MFGAFRNPVPAVAPIHQPLNANSRVQEWMSNERSSTPSRERNSDDQIDVPKSSYFAPTSGATTPSELCHNSPVLLHDSLDMLFGETWGHRVGENGGAASGARVLFSHLMIRSVLWLDEFFDQTGSLNLFPLFRESPPPIASVVTCKFVDRRMSRLRSNRFCCCASSCSDSRFPQQGLRAILPS